MLSWVLMALVGFMVQTPEYVQVSKKRPQIVFRPRYIIQTSTFFMAIGWLDVFIDPFRVYIADHESFCCHELVKCFHSLAQDSNADLFIFGSKCDVVLDGDVPFCFIVQTSYFYWP